MSQLDRAFALEVAGGDRELVRELAGLFASECGNLLAQLRTGVHTNDLKAVEQSAHALKGLVANFGAVEISGAASRLEMAARAGDVADTTTLEHALTELSSELRSLSAGETA